MSYSDWQRGSETNLQFSYHSGPERFIALIFTLLKQSAKAEKPPIKLVVVGMCVSEKKTKKNNIGCRARWVLKQGRVPLNGTTDRKCERERDCERSHAVKGDALAFQLVIPFTVSRLFYWTCASTSKPQAGVNRNDRRVMFCDRLTCRQIYTSCQSVLKVYAVGFFDSVSEIDIPNTNSTTLVCFDRK